MRNETNTVYWRQKRSVNVNEELIKRILLNEFHIEQCDYTIHRNKKNKEDQHVVFISFNNSGDKEKLLALNKRIVLDKENTIYAIFPEKQIVFDTAVTLEEAKTKTHASATESRGSFTVTSADQITPKPPEPEPSQRRIPSGLFAQLNLTPSPTRKGGESP